MDDLRRRLIQCFQIVFPALTEDVIVRANQGSVAAWDSVAAITLMNVIEEEFQVQLDLDRLAELDSFQSVLEYLQREVRA